ncbi:(+)-neomenthol dehydrogenase-like, partial [Vicia villosa]|uniref:(+)-neomenthol dehydrogenase-like n=1 Tax=Vicia villosa TaxID=3911 RepID=UPI00273CF170
WADYYNQTEVSCAPVTENLSVPSSSTLGCPISAATSSYATLQALVRSAVVTGSNKRIGFEIVKQLAEARIKVVLTARDEQRGLQALETLKASGLSDFVVFHQLDVADVASVAALAHFVKSQFGKLDILVDNARIGGVEIKYSNLFSSALITNGQALSNDELRSSMTQTYESTKECLQINYHGAKTTFEYLLPLLQLSDSPRVVNVSSALGKIEHVSNEWAKGVFGDVENLTEKKIDEVLKEFIKEFEEGSLERKGWPRYLAAYTVAKVSMHAIMETNVNFGSVSKEMLNNNICANDASLYVYTACFFEAVTEDKCPVIIVQFKQWNPGVILEP